MRCGKKVLCGKEDLGAGEEDEALGGNSQDVNVQVESGRGFSEEQDQASALSSGQGPSGTPPQTRGRTTPWGLDPHEGRQNGRAKKNHK